MQIILASGSPRRRQLLAELGIAFTVQSKDIPEDFPSDMPAQEVPVYLAYKKAKAFSDSELHDKLVITADTVVILEGKVLNKPATAEEAFEMLSALSGKQHEVVTGVCFRSEKRIHSFWDTTQVFFKHLSPQEIDFYIRTHKPFDKAGAYGAQEWMGMVGVERIEGSYFNVMGLPIHKVYEELRAAGVLSL